MILVRTGSTSTTTPGGWGDQTPTSARVDSVATGGRRAIWRRGRPRGDPCGAARRKKNALARNARATGRFQVAGPCFGIFLFGPALYVLLTHVFLFERSDCVSCGVSHHTWLPRHTHTHRLPPALRKPREKRSVGSTRSVRTVWVLCALS